MTTQPARSPTAAKQTKPLSRTMVLLFAFACGATTANVYYAQSIAGPIAVGLHLPESLAGLIVTTIQLGYGLGLFFLVCIADLVENRRLVLIATSGTLLSLLGVVASTSAPALIITSLALGVCTVGSQILLPLAVRLSAEEQRGQVIGNIMGGLVAGIMLSRPLASFFYGLLGLEIGIHFLSRRDARRVITAGKGLAGMAAHARPTLWGHAFVHAALAQNVAGATAPRSLPGYDVCGVQHVLDRGSVDAACSLCHGAKEYLRFCVGRGGRRVFGPPLAGQIADRGGSRTGTGLALLFAAVAMLISEWGQAVGSLLMIVAAAIILDASTQANQVFGLRTIQSLDAEARGRLNAAYMTVIFFLWRNGFGIGINDLLSRRLVVHLTGGRRHDNGHPERIRHRISRVARAVEAGNRTRRLYTVIKMKNS
ncbi:MFS transporter [Acerihabitans sp. KWT182]|uniref:MFS transporter n=1 Tax=Acerihabitans sp. KWT182 TaxID=3157919 RepID=A0AAU7Q8I1_9GAMM